MKLYIGIDKRYSTHEQEYWEYFRVKQYKRGKNFYIINLWDKAIGKYSKAIVLLEPDKYNKEVFHIVQWKTNSQP